MPDQRDFVLTPVQYAFVQDGTSGNVRVWVGPLANPLNQNDRLVIWNGTKFVELKEDEVATQAKHTFTTATENQYVVLENPATAGAAEHPATGTATAATSLAVGKRVVIPGPVTFPLWPGQRTKVIDGHRLSYNEYLSVQCYDAEAANASEAIEEAAVRPSGEEVPEARRKPEPERPWKVGERRIITGTKTSFYIPPTGIEVLRENRERANKDEDLYARKAAVLRQLDYVCLESETGRQRYVEGPAVVFPEPDETFVTEHGERVFRKLDLNAISGLHIKVNQDYQHDSEGTWLALRGAEMVPVKKGEWFREGDELFVTGKDIAIYMPRAEHGVIEYGDYKRKHHGIALPAGEGRYILDRMGKKGVEKIVGPDVFLPDPRTQVIVRRVFDPKTVNLWYPGNAEALRVNVELAGEQASQGGQYLSSEPQFAATAAPGQAGSLAKSSSRVVGGMPAARIKRGTEYTPTRTITLDTKYVGIPRISVWPGYAVMVMDPTGHRRVEEGPVDLLPEYHETLMALTLSTGRPKGSGLPIQTVYLRTLNNVVGDRIEVTTRDLVPVTIGLALRVNFEAETDEERARWFAVEDYVALLTDSVRSRLKNLAKQHNIQEFMEKTTDLIRDFLLGTATEETRRPGYTFYENGMRLYDVEVLDVSIEHPGVRQMLNAGTERSVEGAIRISQEREETDRLKTMQALERERIDAREATEVRRTEASQAAISREAETALHSIAAALNEAIESAKVSATEREQRKLVADQEVEIANHRNASELARQTKENELYIERIKGLSPQLVEAVRVSGDQVVGERLAEHLGRAAIATGMTTAEFAERAFAGTPLEGIMSALATRRYSGVLTDGHEVNGGE